MKLSKLLTIISFLIILSNSIWAQEKFKVHPIFNYLGDSIGNYDSWLKPVIILNKEINISPFYKIEVNEKEDRIFVLDFQRGKDLIGHKRYLKIFDLKGNTILSNSVESDPDLVKYEFQKECFATSSDGKLLLWGVEFIDDDTKRLEVVKILNKDGVEISSKKIDLNNTIKAYLNFDINRHGEFILIYTKLKEEYEDDKREWTFIKYNKYFKELWKQEISVGFIDDIEINDNGEIAFLNRYGNSIIHTQEIILMNEMGNITAKKLISPYYTNLTYKSENLINIRNELRNQKQPRLTIELNKN